MNYTIRKHTYRQDGQLVRTRTSSRRMYSQTVTTFWRVVRRKGVYGYPSLQACVLITDANLHAHTIDAWWTRSTFA